MLPMARQRARELRHRGAMFPWRTINGEEASAYYAAGTAQYHINADIMYALRKYVLATGDQQFLERFGAEMLVETARLWVDLAFYSQAETANSVSTRSQDRTNTTRWSITTRIPISWRARTYGMQSRRFNRYGPQHRRLTPRLLLRLALMNLEVDAWVNVADNMFIPYNDRLQIIPQDDGFLDDEPWDFANTPEDHYPLLLFYHPLNIYRKQVLKQADVVLALFLLGDTYSIEDKKRNFDFYDPLTTGELLVVILCRGDHRGTMWQHGESH